MVEKRYQVFVSSTYDDLREERQEVMHALLELDCIPAGMELFPAASEEQWTLIKRVIDDCDYYIVIIGGRYGSVGPDGMSYTEMEYRYALDAGKPIIAFLHEKPETLTLEKSEKDAPQRESLTKFRKLAEAKMCKYWLTAADLGGKVSRSLIQLIKAQPAIGWVRANLVPDKDTASEILALRKENDKLQSELTQISIKPPKDSKQFAQGKDKFVIKFSFTSRLSLSASLSTAGFLTTDEAKETERNSKFTTTWDKIFSTIAPLMMGETSDNDIRSALNAFIKKMNYPDLQKQKEFRDKSLLAFKIDESNFNTIIVQLRVLGLIQRIEKKRSSMDKKTYWILTSYGDTRLTKFYAVQRTTQD